MLGKGMIQPSVSPYASPVVLVNKSDNSYRFCVDYRKLISVTKKDSFPYQGLTIPWICYKVLNILQHLI